METITLSVEFDREEDGRWIADVIDMPGVLVYGSTRDEAFRAAVALAYRVAADKIEHREPVVPALGERVTELGLGGLRFQPIS